MSEMNEISDTLITVEIGNETISFCSATGEDYVPTLILYRHDNSFTVVFGCKTLKAAKEEGINTKNWMWEKTTAEYAKNLIRSFERLDTRYSSYDVVRAKQKYFGPWL